MLIQKLKAVAVVLVVSAVAVGGAFTHSAAGGADPGKKGDREPGHAFAPQGGRAVTDDPLMPPSKPLVPGQPGRNPRPLAPDERHRDPSVPGNGPGPGPGAPGAKSVPPTEPVPVGKIDPKWLRELGNRFDVEVTGRTDGICVGTDLYLYDSDLGTAAVHAGLVKAGEKAVITVTVVKCPKSGEGSTHNGVKSLPWDGATAADTALVLQRLPQKPVAKEPDGLTIDQAILAKRGEKVTVKLEIGSVQYAYHTGIGAKEPRTIMFNPKEGLKDGGKFQVVLSDKAVTPLFNLGLMNARDGGSDYFKGKTIRVTGKVEPMEEPVKKGIDYRLVIFDLENLEVVK